jgi:hypothetical protein
MTQDWDKSVVFCAVETRYKAVSYVTVLWATWYQNALCWAGQGLVLHNCRLHYYSNLKDLHQRDVQHFKIVSLHRWLEMHVDLSVCSEISSDLEYRKENRISILRLIDRSIVLIGWDYIYELRPPMDLLFIPQVIYENGEPWLNVIDRGKVLIRIPELPGNSARSHLVASRRNGRWWIWPCEVFCSYFPNDFTCRKILRPGASGFTSPPKEVVLPLKIHRLGRLWTREPWIQWQAC